MDTYQYPNGPFGYNQLIDLSFDDEFNMQIMQEEEDARLGMPQHHRSFVFINFYLHLFLTGSSPAPSTYLATHVHSVPENLVDYDCLPADYGDHENDAALSDSADTTKIDINNRSAKQFISPTL